MAYIRSFVAILGTALVLRAAAQEESECTSEGNCGSEDVSLVQVDKKKDARKARAHFEASYAQVLDLEECQAQQFDVIADFLVGAAESQTTAINALSVPGFQSLAVVQSLLSTYEDIGQIGFEIRAVAGLMHTPVPGATLLTQVPNLKFTLADSLARYQSAIKKGSHLADKLDAVAGDSWVASAVCPALQTIGDNIARIMKGDGKTLTASAIAQLGTGHGKPVATALLALDGGSISTRQVTVLRKEFDAIQESLKTEGSWLTELGKFMVGECEHLRDNCVASNLFAATSSVATQCIDDFGRMATMCDTSLLAMNTFSEQHLSDQ